MEVPTIYNVPLDPEVATWVETLDDDAREYFEERAGIYEFEAGMSRFRAEFSAKALTEKYMQRRVKEN
jgi:hypothetical protein